MMPGYQASDPENAHDFFLGFFFQSDRPTQYQETHSTVNKKKKGGGGWPKHVNTQELVQTDFQRFTGIGNFTRANVEQTKVYATNKRPGCQDRNFKMHCR